MDEQICIPHHYENNFLADIVDRLPGLTILCLLLKKGSTPCPNRNHKLGFRRQCYCPVPYVPNLLVDQSTGPCAQSPLLKKTWRVLHQLEQKKIRWLVNHLDILHQWETTADVRQMSVSFGICLGCWSYGKQWPSVEVSFVSGRVSPKGK